MSLKKSKEKPENPAKIDKWLEQSLHKTRYPNRQKEI